MYLTTVNCHVIQHIIYNWLIFNYLIGNYNLKLFIFGIAPKFLASVPGIEDS
jgi:hypothetical protein